MALSDSNKTVRYRCAAYMLGRGLALKVGAEYYPEVAKDLGKFALYEDAVKHPSVAVCDDLLDLFALDSFDWVMVGAGAAGAAEAHKRIKPGGHLIQVGASQELPARGRWRTKDIYDIAPEMRVAIFKKLSSGGREVLPPPPAPSARRACVVRYGAIGDMIMATPLLRALKADGYHVTVNCTGYSAEVLKGNPNVDNILLQEREVIPNAELQVYWDLWGKEYDRYINLSESCEGALLQVEGRREFFTPQTWRHEKFNQNYQDFMMKWSGYPELRGQRGELFFSKPERRDVREVRDAHPKKFLLLWALNGSSFHKRYGPLPPVLGEWLDKHPQAVAILSGDKRAEGLQFTHPQVIPTAGDVPLRTSLALTTVVDCVVGPESMLVNAASCGSVPKIVLLSHSTPENLTKYWDNCQALEPSRELAPCYPCHQLHYSLESCPQAALHAPSGEKLVEGPTCAMGAIEGERIQEALDAVYNKWARA